MVDKADTSDKISMATFFFAILSILIFLFVVTEFYGDCDKDGQIKENYRNYGNYTNYSVKSRAKRIADVNERRCDEGRFYVNCHACGRKRVVQELYGKKPGCKTCSFNKDPSRSYCVDDCKNRANDTMSFYNENYVDTDHIFCYNCLLDRYFPPDGVSKTPFAKNYIYWPSLEDPNNGVPYS